MLPSWMLTRRRAVCSPFGADTSCDGTGTVGAPRLFGPAKICSAVSVGMGTTFPAHARREQVTDIAAHTASPAAPTPRLATCCARSVRSQKPCANVMHDRSDQHWL